MNRRSLLLGAIGAVCFSTSLAHAAAVEGKQYVRLETPIANAQGTIIKLWSYSCPFCFRFDEAFDPEVMPRIASDSHLKLVPIHIESKGQHGRLASQILASLWLEDEAAGRSVNDTTSLYSRAKHAWYEGYHRQGQRWSNSTDGFVLAAAKATGIEKDVLLNKANQPAAIQLADEWKGLIEVAKIQGIPGYVVNGRYLVMTKAIRGVDYFVDLVNELAQKND